MTYDDISIVPLSEDPDASEIPLPSDEQTENNLSENVEEEIEE